MTATADFGVDITTGSAASGGCPPSPASSSDRKENGDPALFLALADRPQKLRGRALFESLGSPSMVVAPMVDQSEYAWRVLCRSYLPSGCRSLITVSPMLHSRIFQSNARHRDTFFRPLRNGSLTSPIAVSDRPYSDSKPPFLDGNPATDRPLVVQFCANEPETLLAAAKYVQPFCDAVELNLGCPQAIARKGQYGAFLQENWPLIHSLISTLDKHLHIPVTAKFRLFETKEKTVEYANMLLDAGAAWISLHGRYRDQKGHLTGLADWEAIKYVRSQLSDEVVMFANGNVLEHEDLAKCRLATGTDGVLSAEGCLSNPAIFAPLPSDATVDSFDPLLHWFPRPDDATVTSTNQRGGWRVDAVIRRYLDIIYTHVLDTSPPVRSRLYSPARLMRESTKSTCRRPDADTDVDADGRPSKRARTDEMTNSPTITPTPSTQQPECQPSTTPKEPKGKKKTPQDPSLRAIQAHLFALLPRRLLTLHPETIRTGLAKCRAGDMDAFEQISAAVDEAVADGMKQYETGQLDGYGEPTGVEKTEDETGKLDEDETDKLDDEEEDNSPESKSSRPARNRCRRAWWLCQSYVRPVPAEALLTGAVTKKGEQSKEKCG